jgi:hypothetical protein
LTWCDKPQGKFTGSNYQIANKLVISNICYILKGFDALIYLCGLVPWQWTSLVGLSIDSLMQKVKGQTQKKCCGKSYLIK